MKKILIFVALFGAMFSSCYDDKGNYDYTIIEGAENISSLLKEALDSTAFPSAVLFEEYKVDVKLPSEITDNYDIYWESISRDNPGKICDGTTLTYVPEKLISTLNLHIVARHKIHGTEYVAPKQININASYGQGWLILGKKDGKSTFSFIEPISDGDYVNPQRLDWKISENFKTDINPNAKEIDVVYYSFYDENNNQIMMNYITLKDNGDGELLDAIDFRRLSTMTENAMAQGYNNYKTAFYSGDISVYLSEDNLLYSKQGNSPEDKFASTPLAYKGKTYKASAILAPDQMIQIGPNDACYAPILNEEGTAIKFISMDKEGGMGIPGEIFDIKINQPTDIDLNNLPPSTVVTSLFSKYNSNTNFMYYIILKTDSKYNLLTFEIERSSSWDFDMATGELIITEVMNYGNAKLKELNNGTITDNTILVKGDENGNHHFFFKDKKIYVITADGDIAEYFTLEDEILEINTNPQASEIIAITKSGKFIVISVAKDLQNPEITLNKQFDVDEFIDVTYKYSTFMDARTEKKD